MNLRHYGEKAPHEQAEEQDRGEVLILYAMGAVILLMVVIAAVLWWL